MKFRFPGLAVLLLFTCTGLDRKDYPFKPVPFTDVEIDDDFWATRFETNRKVTIPFCFRKCEETGRIGNFGKAAGLIEGRHQGRPSTDSDVYKIMEGAFYSLSQEYDKKLDTYLDSLIILIAEAQEDDGYLYTARTIHPESTAVSAGTSRWSYLYASHELYNVGHLYEAAVASYMATGKEILSEVALKNAGLIDGTFGRDKRSDVPGHQEIEIGLVKLYRMTGDKKYLELARFFLDARGHHARTIPPDSLSYYRYNQNHEPVTEQEEAVGHAVRALYMYSAMADVAALTGNQAYVHAIDTIWENIVHKKMYITGGVGSSGKGESFGEDYDLPNASAYNETCAAIGNALFNHRLFLLHGDSKYIDVLERILYNGFLSGVSLSGDLFFYCNPLESDGEYLFNKGSATRQRWFNTSCCPSNIARFMPSIPGYIYATQDDDLYINLFIGSSASVALKSTEVTIRQETGYPWDGNVRIRVIPEKEAKFNMKIRIPGWVENRPVPGDLYHFKDRSDAGYAIKVNGEIILPPVKKGYAVVGRKWKTGDVIELEFPMPVRQVVANPKVRENTDKVSLQRGPVVYCAEWIDNEDHAGDIGVSGDAVYRTEFLPETLNGIVMITGDAELMSGQPQRLSAVPYYAWSHRGTGKMAVWLPAIK